MDRLRVPRRRDLGRSASEFVARLVDSVETTLRAGEGLLIADLGDGDELALERAERLPALRPQLSRALAAAVQLQLAAGHVPRLQRPGHAAEG